MFLDNVLFDRKLVVKPWREYKTEGNSLFLWRLGYGVICLVVFGLYLTFSISTLYDMWNDYDPEGMILLTSIALGLIFLLLVIISAYISLFLNDFIDSSKWDLFGCVKRNKNPILSLLRPRN